MRVPRDVLPRFLLLYGDPLRQLRPRLALPSGVPDGAWRSAGSARASAWCRHGGETAFCAARRPRCGCFRRLSVRARPLCNFSSPGIASLFTGAFILDAGFGEPDPGCHAGAARSPVRCARALLVSFEPHAAALERSNMAGCEAQAPPPSLPECSLLDKRWALSGWLQLFGSLQRVFSEQHYRRDLRLSWHRARMQPVRSVRCSSEIGSTSCASLHLYASCSRPRSFSAATPCMMRSPSSAGVMPGSRPLFRACFGRNRSRRRSWCFFFLDPGCCKHWDELARWA